MTFVFILVLFIILIFFVLPRLMWRLMVDRVRRKTDAFFGGQGGGRQAPRQGQPQRPRRPRKKIDPDVGEYVDFEDIPVYKDPTSAAMSDVSSTIKYEVEEQIEDIEWEDVDK